MTNEIIKPHNFEIAKNQILALSQDDHNVSLQKFKTEGNIIPWNDHNVTGKEINNSLVSPLQDTLRFQNTNIRILFKITNEVYKALESLDKEYIQAIIAAVKSAEIASGQAKTASNQAKDASREALEASRKANNAQEGIKKTIEALQATVKILKDFKEKVSKEIPYFSTINSKLSTFQAKILAIEHDNKLVSEAAKLITELETSILCQVHIKDIDTIWNDVENHKGNLDGLHSQLDAFVEKVNQVTENINGDIAALQQYRSLLESYKHLGDIDTIWNEVENHKDNLDALHSQLDTVVEKVNQVTENINSDIAALQQYRSLLESYEHLGDVDTIWNDVEGHKDDLTSLHSQIGAFVEMADLTVKHINSDIKALQQHRSTLESYKHLGDIDAIWKDVEDHKDNLDGLHSQIDAFVKKVNQVAEDINSDIAALQQYRSLLESYEHLGDIDAIWNDVEGHKKYLNNIDTKLTDFISETHSVTTSIKEGINTIERMQIERNIIVDKKIKIAYGIAGGAIAFSVIQLILQLLGIL